MSNSNEADGAQLVARRRRPKRTDSRQTINLILESTAQLLQQSGFEGLSTNMICKHAGLTPPALYHYYPNKYAILFDLAHRLLGEQHSALDGWLDSGGLIWTDDAEAIVALVDLQSRLRCVADDQVGALWIIRGMRAIPRLREVRLAAHKVMQDRFLDALCLRCHGATRSDLSMPSFLLGEILLMGTELELDHPDEDVGRMRECLALAVMAYVNRLGS